MARVVASFFGIGLIIGRWRGSDSGSGTLAGAVALGIAVAVNAQWGWQGILVGAIALTLAGLWASHRLAGEYGDAGWIVIDEAAGSFIAIVGLTTFPVMLAAFAVFRLADIVKRGFPGVLRGERLPGAFGIMGDDVVAGLYGLAVGHLIQAII